jgi:Putative DNA-binding domain
MTRDEVSLAGLLAHRLDQGENEVVEFKEANDNSSTSDIGKYFSAIANEVNLRGADAGWLVFGVQDKTRSVVGTIRHRRQDDAHYRHLILDFLKQFKQASRDDLRDMLLPILPDVLSDTQKEIKLKNLLAALRRDGLILREGPPVKSLWRLS